MVVVVVVVGLTPLQRCSQCILQPRPTRQERWILGIDRVKESKEHAVGMPWWWVVEYIVILQSWQWADKMKLMWASHKCTDFVYTQLNVKTVLYKTIQFSVSTVSMSKAVLFQTIQFSISTHFTERNFTERNLP